MANKTILVVDDEKDLLDLIEYNLKKEGFNVLKAENGEEGIAIAKEHKPDLVLMDIMMPKMDGMEAVEKMRADDELKSIPIIFLTARSDEKTEVEGLDKGGDDYITKPISTTKLISRIKAVMRRFDETEEEVNRLDVHDLSIDKDRYIVNLIELDKDDTIKAFVPVKTLEDEDYINNHSIIMATKGGLVKKTTLEAYSRPRRDGIIAINIKDDDSLLAAELTDGDSQVLLANKNGRAIRFHESEVRDMGRNTSGVKGMTLGKKDEIVDMVIIRNTHEATVLAMSENGYGKRSLVDDYREQSRGGKGVITLKVTPKTGNLIALKEVTDQDDLMIITEKGKVIRMSCGGIRTMGRNTQGVRVMRLDSDGSIAAVTRVVNEDDDETSDDS